MSEPDTTRRPRRILNSTCSICGSLASSHNHYGAISCYSCRAFFRRGLPRQATCIFQTNKCQINCFNRTNCKKCRYNRCLEAGMKPELVDAALKKRGSGTNSTSSSMSVQDEENPEDEVINQKVDRKPVLEDNKDVLDSMNDQDYKTTSPVKSCKYVVGTDEIINNVKKEEFIIEHETLKKRVNLDENQDRKVKLDHDSSGQLHDKSNSGLSLDIGMDSYERKCDFGCDSYNRTCDTGMDSYDRTWDFECEFNINSDCETRSNSKCVILCDTFTELAEGSMMNVDSLLNYYLEKESKRLKEEQESSWSSASPVKSLLSLQRQHQLQEIVYPVTSAINQKLSLPMGFTSEEDLYVKSLLYKREIVFMEYFQCLQSILPTMHNHIINFINCIRFNKPYRIEEQIIQSVFDVMKSINLKHMKWLYPEFTHLSTSYIHTVLSSTCNALFSCFFALLLCKNRSNRLVDQWVNFFLSPAMGKWILGAIPDLITTRSCSLDDFEMFASPWAASIEDEEYFKSTISELVEVIDGDDTLIALYGLLIRISPRESQDSAVKAQHSCLKPIQDHIRCLIFGYLRRKFSMDSHKASQVTTIMQGLIEKLHNCGDIFFRKRLIIMYKPNQFLEDRVNF